MEESSGNEQSSSKMAWLCVGTIHKITQDMVCQHKSTPPYDTSRSLNKPYAVKKIRGIVQYSILQRN